MMMMAVVMGMMMVGVVSAVILIASASMLDAKRRPSPELDDPFDEKPKSVAAGSLKRVKNIRANPKVAFVIDDYSDDWSRLAYVLVSGTAEIISTPVDASEHKRAVELLRQKYPQYRSMKLEERPIIKITPLRIKRWASGEGLVG